MSEYSFDVINQLIDDPAANPICLAMCAHRRRLEGFCEELKEWNEELVRQVEGLEAELAAEKAKREP